MSGKVSKASQELLTLKVTTDEEGSVWYLEGAGLPFNSGKGEVDFVRDHLGSDHQVRVVGTHGNAALLLELYRVLKKGELASLEVCSPLVCESPEDRRDPELLLYYARSFASPSSLGGWHHFTDKDFFSYALCRAFQLSPDITPWVEETAMKHPAWPSASFVDGLSPGDFARLAALVLDPRWYIDPDEPGRGSRLEQYLGLNPRTQSLVSNNKPGGWLSDRCKLVRQCWHNERILIRTGRSCGKSTAPTQFAPNQFLLRVMQARGYGTRGELGASRHFVEFVRYTWLNSVCASPKVGHLFVPEYFFEKPDEVEAYRDHLKIVTKEVRT